MERARRPRSQRHVSNHELADGELRILPAERVRERVRQVARRVMSEHREAMDILANYEPDEDKNRSE